ncbi:MAG: ABC transporter permease [Alistipes sp.]
MSQVGIIISREFNERVRKRSFIITTILVPILFLALMIVPALIMVYFDGDTKQIAVIDQSGLIAPSLQSDEEMVFIPTDATLEAARADESHFGVLFISADVVEKPNNVQLYTNSSSSMSIESNISRQIASAIEGVKLRRYNIDNLQQIMEEVKTSVTLQSFRNDQGEEGKSQSAGVAYGIGYALAFILYMFLLMYGQMVMQSVIEEKGSRVLDVLITSVKPFQLMLGKILGIASVAITQIVIWGVLIFAIGAIGSAVIMPKMLSANDMQQLTAMQSGSLDTAAVSADNLASLQIFATLTNFSYIAMIFAYLLLFLIGGYLLYSALFAAVGASVDNVSDAGQLTMIITTPIIFAIIAMMAVMKDPNSGVAFWCSMIPFTSPIVMMARIPAGIPLWEPILSLILLFGTTVVMIWFAAKIYRVGIFMHGKKPTIKELYKWMTYKY